MIRVKIYLVFTMVLATICSSLGQSGLKPGYIIDNNRDTVYGKVLVEKSQNYCFFKKSDANEVARLFPDSIIACRVLNGKYYVSQLVKENNGLEKWYFLEYLVEGEINLYTIKKQGRYFLEKHDGPFFEIDDNIESTIKKDNTVYIKKDNKYKGLLKFYMSETPELFHDIESLNGLTQKSLVDLSVNYHNLVCDDHSCVNYTKKINNRIYKFEFSTGVDYHNNYYSPMVSFKMNQSWRDLPLYLVYGVRIEDLPYSFKDSYYVMSDDRNLIEKTDPKYMIMPVLGLKYVFGKKRLKPTIASDLNPSVILGLDYSVNNKLEITTHFAFDGLLTRLFNEQKSFYNNNFPHSFGFGICYRIK